MNYSKKKYVKLGNMMVSEKEAKQIAEHPKRNFLLLITIAIIMFFLIRPIALIALFVAVSLLLITPSCKEALDGPRYTQTGELWSE